MLKSWALFFLASFCATHAYADVAHFYVKSWCDQTSGVLTITSYTIFNDAIPPQGARLISDIGSQGPPIRPEELCNLGPKRNVAAVGIVDSSAPSYSFVKIFVGSRPVSIDMPVASANYISIAKIRALPQDYYIDVEICAIPSKCTHKKRTDPSFQCGINESNIDRLICNNDELSSWDAALFDYSGRMRLRGAPYSKSKISRSDWLKILALKCNIPSIKEPWNDRNFEEIIKCISGSYSSISNVDFQNIVN